MTEDRDPAAPGGPLSGVRIVEIAAIGPAPFATMMLADMGADVLRLERPPEGALAQQAPSLINRNRRSAVIDLKAPGAPELVLELLSDADGLIEGFRPGAMERLGLGPEPVLSQNPRLVYGRMTGYGQDGPLHTVAGHDINYLAIAGALGAIGRPGERPQPPLNLVADYGGGGMLLAFGMVCGILVARTSGQGQVVDAAMVDGVAILTTLLHSMRAAGRWSDTPGTNLLDSGAPFYEVYETADGGHVAVGALEPQFYARLLELLGIPEAEMPQNDRARWPEYKRRLAATFRARTRQEWNRLFEAEEACVSVVLAPGEAPDHPQLRERRTFVSHEGVRQPAPAPRFERTPGRIRAAPSQPGEQAVASLRAWGIDEQRLARALREGVAIDSRAGRS